MERYTRTDNIYLVKNASFMVLTQSVSILNGFVLYILISHFLSKEAYGQYKYFLSLFSLFALTTFTGMKVAVARDVANNNDGALKAGFRRKLLGGFVGSAISFMAAGYYLFVGRNDLSIALVLIGICSPWIYAANIYTAIFVGKKRFDTYSKINITTGIISFIAMACVFVLVKNPVWLFAAFLGTNSIIFFAYAIARRAVTNTRVGGDMLSYATYLSKLDVLGLLATSIDGILIYHFLGASALAIYSFAIIPVEQIKGILLSVQSVAMPKFTVNSLSHMQKTLGRKVLIFMLGITILTVVYILLTPFFFRVAFPAYADAIPYSQVYSLSLVFVIPASLLLTLFTAKGLRRETTRFNILNYSVQIILLVLGSWLYGLWGAIFARLITRILMYLTSHQIFKNAEEQGSIEMSNPF
jgi:O-antigen/teichoic acid export membrane protein